MLKPIKEFLMPRPTIVILAGGNGTRMGRNKVKPLLKLQGKTIIDWTLKTSRQLNPKQIIVVSGRQNMDKLKKHLSGQEDIQFVYQDIDGGTANALYVALPFIKSKHVLVLFGDDSALYTKDTLRSFINKHRHSKMAVVALHRDEVGEVGGLDVKNGEVHGVMTLGEHTRRGLTESITMCGCMFFNKGFLKRNLKRLTPSPYSGEYTLPSLFKFTKAKVFSLPDKLEWSSVNTPEELAQARSNMRKLINNGKK